jgi:hypothetical protein
LLDQGRASPRHKRILQPAVSSAICLGRETRSNGQALVKQLASVETPGYLDGARWGEGERLLRWISPLSAVLAFRSPDFVSAR